MGDRIALTVAVAIILAVIRYIVKQKKKGAKCIGCPSGCKGCEKSQKQSSCSCACNTQDKTDK